MDRSELVLSIVFDCKETFNHLSRHDTANVILATKMSETNENITLMKNKYTAEHLYDKFHSAATSLVFAKNKNDKDKEESSKEKIDNVFDMLENSSNAVYNYFCMLMMAEYKEMIFNSICDPTFDNIEADILGEFNNIIDNDRDLYHIARKHYHDPYHVIFQNKPSYYSFYYMAEANGLNMIEMYETGNYDDLIHYDDNDNDGDNDNDDDL
jgi:hypothetical protein